MAKVMLVEDDNNLREIYVARLAAEGYETVSAHDGEEALALAVKEKPDLIISDVMMPKISGFDMLDILRSTPETKNTKVIMMTALSQAEDRSRADKLGADRYLVKSQVTLEDVIKVAHEVLGDGGATTSAPPSGAAASAPASGLAAAPAPPPTPTTADLPVAEPPAVATAPAAPAPTPQTPPSPPEPEPPVAPPAEPTAAPSPAPEPSPMPAAPEPTVPPIPAPPSEPAPAPPTPAVSTDTTADSAAPTAPPLPPAEPTPAPTEPATPPKPINTDLTQTEAAATDGVEKQIQDFINNNPTISDKPTTDKPAVAPAADVTAPPITMSTNDATTPTPATTEAPSIESPPKTADGDDSVIKEPPSHRKLVLQPTKAATEPSVDLNALLEKENAKAATATPATSDVVKPSEDKAEAVSTPGTETPSDIAL